MTREHIFRSAWKDKLDVSIFPIGSPLVERKVTRYRLDNTVVRSTVESLFSISVRRVCASCNNNWMNNLDSAVEPWVFDPLNNDNRCDASAFRRWAIKIALLRSHYENPLTIEPSDPAMLFAGNDNTQWRVFIGRTAHPDHRHAFAGLGPILPGGGRGFAGVTQVSWTLGYSFVVALRLVSDNDWSKNCLRNFKSYNRSRGIQMVEVLPTAQSIPSVNQLPPLLVPDLLRLIWFFTPNPVSPIADAVRATWADIKETFEQVGAKWYELE